MKCIFNMRKTVATLLLLVFCLAAGAQSVVEKMSLEEKARCVVGFKRALWPPTNNGIPGRTTPLPAYGIPSLVLADGTAGVRLSRRGQERATAFPADITLASSWSAEVVREVGAAVGDQALAYQVDVMLAPGMNIIRNPLCGRIFEYFSEDPVITGKMGAAYIEGLQSRGIGGCAKHFTCNSQETNRGHNDVRIAEKALREIYLRGFEICVREAKPWTVMSSYNSVNGAPVQEQRRLLTDILRGEWGFDGAVMTDWSIVPHNTAAQLHAGNDLFMPGADHQVEAIIAGVKDGTIAESDLDLACERIIALAQKCADKKPASGPDLEAGRAVAHNAACESAVLMENNGMLPLSGGGRAALFGVRSYDLVARGAGAGFVVCPPVTQIYAAFRDKGIPTDEEIEDLYLKYVAFAEADIRLNEKIKVHIGLPLLPELALSKKFVESAAERDDYAVITLGRTSQEGTDRKLKDDYYLSDTEKALLGDVCEAFHARGKKVAVILNIAGIIETESWKSLPDAILNVWLPGQDGGAAVADLLFGKVNPSGRLAVTFPKDYFDVPGAEDFPYGDLSEGRNYDYTCYDEGCNVGYRHYLSSSISPSYSFGYGLSYTEFKYSRAKVRTTSKKTVVSVTVANSGAAAGKEAVGVYVASPDGIPELKAFAKTGLLAPGSSETLTFEIPADYLKTFNEGKNCWEKRRGRLNVLIGADPSDPKIKLTK